MAGTGSKRENNFKCKICRMVFESKEELKIPLMDEYNKG